MYVSLHNRSAYSFGTALTQPHELTEFAVKHGMPAIALTDLGGLYGAVAFQEACKEAGIKPILGAELQLAGGAGVTLLAMDLTGYGQLCRLVTRRHLDDAPLHLAHHADLTTGLICLPGAAPGGAAGLRAALLGLRELFADRLYVELSLHAPEDASRARQRAQLADELAIPVVAACASRCVRRDQALLLRALLSIGTLTLLDQPHPDKPPGLHHLRTPAEMRHLFARRPDALSNTQVIAERCNVELELSRNRFPAFVSPDGRNAMEHLTALAVAGCRRRYVDEPPQRGIGGRRPTLQEALERVYRELAIIERVQYAEYFLVFHEIVQHCRERGIATLARGSAADSLVCYALGVSHACPFRFDLPFDRFVNPERARFSKMADIDLDLPWDRRDEVIDWVYERYGSDRVAMIGAANTYRARGAVAELGKVYGLAPSEVHQATRLLGWMTARNLPESIARSPEARDIPVDEEPYRTILRLAAGLQGLPHHWAMHPCGLVVSPEPLADVVPVQRSAKGPLVAQYDMDTIEDLGFVKVDLLGQAGLAVLRDAVAEIERTAGARVDLEHDVDYSEPSTWDMIAGGRARGVHHIESPAMTSLLVQCDCRDIDCLTSVVAIIRPGAANQGKKEAFARRHQGLEPPGVVHPSIAAVLEQTYGLMVFEEHILQVATEFAGMNLGRADVLRRALNKENTAMVRQLQAEFAACARRRGRSAAEIAEVWPLLEGFAGFMFNKAHSAEYAVEAFQGAWLKHRWPAHYLAAILSNYRGFYAHSPTLPQICYVLEAHHHGIGLLPPCVNRSREGFSVECGADGRPMIRVPLGHIHGLPAVLVERMAGERCRGRFESLEDFVQRCRPGSADAQALLECGALDEFCPVHAAPAEEAKFHDEGALGRRPSWTRPQVSRASLFWQLRTLLRDELAGSGRLWRPQDLPAREAPAVELTEPDLQDIARCEMERLGFPISEHPLDHLGRSPKGEPIDWSRYVPIRELGRHLGRPVQVCGLMVADRTNSTQGGELMKFVTLGDRTAFVETLLFPDAYQRHGHLLVRDPILEAQAVVDPFENRKGFTLRVQRIGPPAYAGRRPPAVKRA
jgi:DNA-directed DNA polymerase III PolC